MSRNILASFSLSVLTVLIFSVLLYQPDTPPPIVAEASDGPAVPEVEIVEARPPDAKAASPPPTELVGPSRPSAGPADGPPGGANPTTIMTTARVARREGIRPTATALREHPSPTPDPPAPTPVEAHAHGNLPRPAFTRVLSGESLGDVALRLYGSVDARETLYRANRDVLDRSEGPIPAGMVLRTP